MNTISELPIKTWYELSCVANVENLIGELGKGGTVVSESGLSCKGSFRSCNTFAGVMVISVDTIGFGRT